jgi:hypothetical protein
VVLPRAKDVTDEDRDLLGPPLEPEARGFVTRGSVGDAAKGASEAACVADVGMKRLGIRYRRVARARRHGVVRPSALAVALARRDGS